MILTIGRHFAYLVGTMDAVSFAAASQIFSDFFMIRSNTFMNTPVYVHGLGRRPDMNNNMRRTITSNPISR
jgi:hypothetical protein